MGGAAISCLDFAGNWLLAGSKDGVARLWLMGSGRLLRVLQADCEAGAVADVSSGCPLRAVSVGREWLLTASARGQVLLWDASDGRCLRRFWPLTSTKSVSYVASPSCAQRFTELLDFQLAGSHALALSAMGEAVRMAWSTGAEGSRCVSNAETQLTGPGFDIDRLRRHICNFAPEGRMDADAAAMMGAVLETVAARLLRSAAGAARRGATGRIEPSHIWDALGQDLELAELAALPAPRRVCAVALLALDSSNGKTGPAVERGVEKSGESDVRSAGDDIHGEALQSVMCNSNAAHIADAGNGDAATTRAAPAADGRQLLGVRAGDTAATDHVNGGALRPATKSTRCEGPGTKQHFEGLAKDAASAGVLAAEALAELAGAPDGVLPPTGGRSAESMTGFQAERLRRHIQHFSPSLNMEHDVPAMMAAVLETVTAKLLRAAGNFARESHVGRIEPKHIKEAFECDAELSLLRKAGLAPMGEEPVAGPPATGSLDAMREDDEMAT